jgi:hypothetical protein
VDNHETLHSVQEISKVTLQIKENGERKGKGENMKELSKKRV